VTLASVTPRYFAPVRELDILLLCLVTVTTLATAPPEERPEERLNYRETSGVFRSACGLETDCQVTLN